MQLCSPIIKLTQAQWSELKNAGCQKQSGSQAEMCRHCHVKISLREHLGGCEPLGLWGELHPCRGRRVPMCPPPPEDLSLALCDRREPHWQGWPRLLIRPHNPGARRLNLRMLSQRRIAASRGHAERTGHYRASFKVLLAVTARLFVVFGVKRALEPAEHFYWYFKYLKGTGA